MGTEQILLLGSQAEAELDGFRMLAFRAETAAVEALRTVAQSGIVEDCMQLAEARARLDALVEISRNKADESAVKRAGAEREVENAMQYRDRQLAALDEAQMRIARLSEEKAAHQVEAADMHRRIQDQQAEVNSLIAERDKAIANRRCAEKWCWVPFYGLYLAIDNSVKDYEEKAREAEALKCKRECDLQEIEDRYSRCAEALLDAERRAAEEAQCQRAIQETVIRLQNEITEHKQVFALWDTLCLYYLSLVNRFEGKLLDRRGLQRELQETGSISLTI